VTIYHAEHDVTLHQGHVLDVLPMLPAGSVNCVVTSPPYYGLRDYGVEGQIGLEASPAEYVETLRRVFAEVRRVLRLDGVLWLNLGDSYSRGSGTFTDGPQTSKISQTGRPIVRGARGSLSADARAVATKTYADVPPEKNLIGIPWRVAFALQDDGWTLRNDVIWAKPNAMPESVTDRLSTRYEHVFLFSKSRRYWFDLDPIREATTGGSHRHSAAANERWSEKVRAANLGVSGAPSQTLGTLSESRSPGDVWTIPTAPYPAAHFATFPPELARRCIAAGCPPDGLVLDPFTGSGTTLMVARRLLRKSVGIELNPVYCELIVDRIGQPIFDFGEATP
jgi:site-specific DNA-methyltransferase (cytosine-N4-specific)